MNTINTDYYHSLSPTEQNVLQLVALYACDLTVSDISTLTSLPQYKLKTLLQTASDQGILTKRHDSWSNTYYPATDFMVFVFPLFNSMDKQWRKAQEYRSYIFYRQDNNRTLFRNCLYSLLFVPKEYKHWENQFINGLTDERILLYTRLLGKEEYRPHIRMINKELLQLMLSRKADYHFNNLMPFSENIRLFEMVNHEIQPDHLTYNSFFPLFHSGRFEEAAKWLQNADEIYAIFLEAIRLFTKDQQTEALLFFEKGLKIQKKFYRGMLFPQDLTIHFYYLTALLSSPPEVSSPLFQKIGAWIKKHEDSPLSHTVFFPVTLAVLEQESREKHINLPLSFLTWPEPGIYSLFAILSLYLSGYKFNASQLPSIKKIVEQAYLGEFKILAYEAAYAFKQAGGEFSGTDIYKELYQELSYSPVLSRIVKQEYWEKALNLLMGIKSVQKKTDEQGRDARIIYYFKPEGWSLQPVAQTRQTKSWSKGRSVSLKSFYEGKTKGMSDQDLRIAKSIKKQSDYYYGDTYDFTNATLVQLIGHPHVFLADSPDIPVSFIEAQPEINIVSTSSGYSLSTNIRPDGNQSIIVIKETNTRYKIFQLTPEQMEVITVLNKRKIVVPGGGKKKLVELLGRFSSMGMQVHSDLLATESQGVKVKEIKPDSRIRVQLLPLGDGLKVELFAKPFGDIPPYCKAGKGGVVLIANGKEEQLQVKRDLQQEVLHENTLLEKIQALESIDTTDDLISFRNPDDSLHLLEILMAHQDICVVEWPEGERYKLRNSIDFDQLKLKVKSGQSWFDMEGELQVDEQTVLSLQQLLNLTARQPGRFIELNPGEFLALSHRLRKQLDGLRHFSSSKQKTLRVNQYAFMALQELVDQSPQVKTDQAYKKFRERISASQAAEVSIPSGLQAELRPYQEEGFCWMARIAAWEGGACLADDMGLGKTIQALSILLHRSTTGPALVVCPVSVLPNWLREAERFAPELKVRTLGNTNRKQLFDTLQAGEVLVASYGLLQSEEELFSQVQFATVVLDEAHAIKNYTTKTAKASMRLNASFRLALTGTPIQNHLGELWNLFQFINPGLLGSQEQFAEKFIKTDDPESKKYLKKLISPFILRRTKSAVLDELPPKTEIVRKIELSSEETAFYEALRRQAMETLSNNEQAGHIQVLAEITRLRLASCNPQLVDSQLSIESSKLKTFLEIVDELRANNHRALVFSQFVTHLTLVRQALDKKNIGYQYLDGSSSRSAREKSIDAFQSGDGDLFLISLKAGGLGLNLTAADYVIHLDPWWNPAVEDQASDRAHRIGQSRPVTIYRLVAENTIEEKIIRLHHTKRDLADSLLEGTDQSAKLNLNELINLIREV